MLLFCWIWYLSVLGDVNVLFRNNKKKKADVNVWWQSGAQTVSGRPPPAASMAVGQFYNPEEGKIELPSLLMLQSIYSHKVIIFLK
jgi:hypothetical protein